MKLATIALGLCLLSTTALAQYYQTEVSFDYSNTDSYDVFGLSGAYYFDHVKTDNTAWMDAN